MRLSRVLIIYLLLIVSIDARFSYYKNQEELNSLLYNFEFSRAEKLLKEDNFNPAHKKYFLIRISFIQSLISGKREFDSKFQKMSTDAEDYFLNEFDKSGNAIFKYYHCSVKTMKAVSLYYKNEFKEAFFIAKEAYNLAKELYEEESIPDSDFDMGLLIFLSYKSRDYQNIFTRLFGFENDIQKALSFLEKASKKSIINKIESVFLLLEIKKLLNYDNPNGINIYQDLYLRFPKNSLICYNYAARLVNAGEGEKAFIILKKEIPNLTNYGVLLSFYNFLLGDIYLTNEEYQNAIKYFQEFPKGIRDNSYIGEANFKTAICYFCRGDKISTRFYLLKTNLGNMEFDDDIEASAKARLFLDNINQKDIEKIFISEILIKNNQLGKVEKLVSALKIGKTEDFSFYSAYVKGLFLLKTNQLKEAYQIFKGILLKKIKENYWLKIAVLIHLSEIKIIAGKNKEAGYFLDLAENINKNSEKQFYSSKIRNLREKLSF